MHTYNITTGFSLERCHTHDLYIKNQFKNLTVQFMHFTDSNLKLSEFVTDTIQIERNGRLVSSIKLKRITNNFFDTRLVIEGGVVYDIFDRNLEVMILKTLLVYAKHNRMNQISFDLSYEYSCSELGKSFISKLLSIKSDSNNNYYLDLEDGYKQELHLLQKQTLLNSVSDFELSQLGTRYSFDNLFISTETNNCNLENFDDSLFNDYLSLKDKVPNLINPSTNFKNQLSDLIDSPYISVSVVLVKLDLKSELYRLSKRLESINSSPEYPSKDLDLSALLNDYNMFQDFINNGVENLPISGMIYINDDNHVKFFDMCFDTYFNDYRPDLFLSLYGHQSIFEKYPNVNEISINSFNNTLFLPTEIQTISKEYISELIIPINKLNYKFKKIKQLYKKIYRHIKDVNNIYKNDVKVYINKNKSHK